VDEKTRDLLEMAISVDPLIWDAYAAHVKTEVVYDFFFGGFFIVAALVLGGFALVLWRSGDHGEKVKKGDLLAAIYCVGAAVACSVSSGFLFVPGVARLINPNYYIIQDLMSALGG